MSNSIPMLRKLYGMCPRDHKHQPLLGGRASHAAFYPLPLLQAILEGMNDTEQASQSVATMVESEYDVSLSMSLCSAVSSLEPESQEMVGSIPKESGGSVQIKYEMKNFRQVYLDEYTREEIPHHLVQQAIVEELNYFNDRVWELSDKTALSYPQSKTIRTRWVITNKGDNEHPDVRARLVEQEVNTYKSDEYFASTPPLEAKRLLFSELASKRKLKDGRALEISFIDIKNAYFNAVPKRRLHLFVPREMGLPQGSTAHLKRCVYGTRDAGQLWEETYSNALLQLGIRRGLASPCCFLQPFSLCECCHPWR